MPETKPLGMLVDPLRAEPQVLTHEETESLRACLTLLREDSDNESDHELYELVSTALHTLKQPHESRQPLASVIFNYLSEKTNGENGAILCDGYDAPILLTTDEFDFLRHALATRRAGTWFSDWLALQIAATGDSGATGDRYPTPGQVASSLTSAAAKWEESLQHARQIANQRPDLLGIEPAKPAATKRPRRKAA